MLGFDLQFGHTTTGPHFKFIHDCCVLLDATFLAQNEENHLNTSYFKFVLQGALGPPGDMGPEGPAGPKVSFLKTSRCMKFGEFSTHFHIECTDFITRIKHVLGFEHFLLYRPPVVISRTHCSRQHVHHKNYSIQECRTFWFLEQGYIDMYWKIEANILINIYFNIWKEFTYILQKILLLSFQKKITYIFW